MTNINLDVESALRIGTISGMVIGMLIMTVIIYFNDLLENIRKERENYAKSLDDKQFRKFMEHRRRIDQL